MYLFVVHLLCSIVFVYLLNKTKQCRLTYLLPMIIFVYRWNFFRFVRFSLIFSRDFSFSSFSSLSPLLYYGLLLYFLIRKEMSMSKILFCLLYLICRTHNCVVIIIHMIFYEYLPITDAPLAFLLSQSAFFHLVRISPLKILLQIVFFSRREIPIHL